MSLRDLSFAVTPFALTINMNDGGSITRQTLKIVSERNQKYVVVGDADTLWAFIHDLSSCGIEPYQLHYHNGRMQLESLLHQLRSHADEDSVDCDELAAQAMKYAWRNIHLVNYPTTDQARAGNRESREATIRFYVDENPELHARLAELSGIPKA